MGSRSKKWIARWWQRPLYGVVSCVLLAACATPTTKFLQDAEQRGLSVASQSAARVFKQGRLQNGQPIHVYLDGDGTPYQKTWWVSKDPTTRNRLILKLISSDSTASVLIGRPCYYGVREQCDETLYTTGRYSEQVIHHLVTAIDDTLAPYPDSPVTLIGYSGGGALAMLVAPSVQQVERIVTIAANLDIERWTQYHDFEPLSGSMNPARQPPLGAHIKQFHLFGENDSLVPASLSRAVIAAQPNAELVEIPGFDHDCCWGDRWPELLADTVR